LIPAELTRTSTSPSAADGIAMSSNLRTEDEAPKLWKRNAFI